MKAPASASRLRRALRELRAFLFPFVAILAAKSSLAAVDYVPSGSMEPTILVGDAVFVNHLAYGLRLPFTTVSLAHWANPQRGDIVVCFEPGDGTRLVKRVVAGPGDTVALHNDVLWVNGLQDMSPHAVKFLPGIPAWRNFGPVTVPAGSYFVMGDNRDNSKDSRHFGCVPRDQIVGRAKGVVVSFDTHRAFLPRLSRSFSRLD